MLHASGEQEAEALVPQSHRAARAVRACAAALVGARNLYKRVQVCVAVGAAQALGTHDGCVQAHLDAHHQQV